MKLYTFTGENPAVALQKAQSACGNDALVVSTKQLQKKTRTSPALYEVVVAIEEKKAPQPLPSSPKREKEDLFVDLSTRAKELSSTLKKEPVVEKEEIKIESELPSFTQAEFEELQRNLSLLNNKLQNLQEVIWENKEEQRAHLTIPPEFAGIYNIAKKSGMSKKHIDAIMKSTLEHMPTYMKNSPQTIERYFHVLLKKMLGVRLEKEIPKDHKKIMMLVGPTGVGKTTTLAKLAARFSFLEYRYKVGIITLDTYRIGAVEQLMQYAKMMKLPSKDVIDTFDFKEALASLDHCDMILIDTVGASQFDREKLQKISKFLESSNRHIDVNLVIAASTKLEDLQDIYENFSFLNLDTMMITKLDETQHFGNIFSLASSTSLPLSYFCAGQEVPDDIMPASADFLIDCIFHGYEKVEA